MPWISTTSGIPTPSANGNGKPMTDDELRAAELAILESVPPPLHMFAEPMMRFQDPTLGAGAGQTEVLGRRLHGREAVR
jgi:hypothetical protein